MSSEEALDQPGSQRCRGRDWKYDWVFIVTSDCSGNLSPATTTDVSEGEIGSRALERWLSEQEYLPPKCEDLGQDQWYSHKNLVKATHDL